MKLTVSKIIALLVLVACKDQYKNNMTVTDFTTSVNASLMMGQPKYASSFCVQVVDYGDIRLFIVPFSNTRSTTTLMRDGTVKFGKETYDTSHVYCFTKKGAASGIRYDSLSSNKGKRFPVDSLLSRLNMGPEHLQENSKTLVGKLLSLKRDKKNGKLLAEAYQEEKDDKLISTYRYYDPQLANLSFSIAPDLDDKMNNKLIRVMIVEKNKVTKDLDRFSFSIKKGKLRYPDSVAYLIQRYTQDSSIKR